MRDGPLLAQSGSKPNVCTSREHRTFLPCREFLWMTQCGPSRGWSICLEGGHNAIATEFPNAWKVNSLLKYLQVIADWLRLPSERIKLDVYRSRVGIRTIVFRIHRSEILSGSIKGVLRNLAAMLGCSCRAAPERCLREVGATEIGRGCTYEPLA